MKQNRSRLIALLLAMCLLVGALPTLALADDAILTMDDYQNARNRVEEALAAPDVPVEQTNQHYVARSSEVESIVKSTVTGDLSVDSATAFALPVAGRLVLRAPEAEAYRWQIRVGDQWANIVGDTESEMVLTYAKLQNALSGNAAVVRCALTRAGETVYTAEATVTVDPNVETETTTVTEQIPVTSYYQPSAVSRAKELNEGVMAANDRPTPSTYTIIINYQFKDGKQAAPSWSATVATGSTYTQDIQSPVVVGYTPSEAVVHVDTSEAKTYNVTYQPAEVNFTVKHYQQNVSNDEYTLADTETKKDDTESAVGAGLAKTDYTGFYSLLYDATTTIAADGSTKVEIYYDRYYYLMNFDLDGGYGVEPIYARYGTSINVGDPTKPGYSFEGWDKEIAKTMPAENTSYKASWTIGDQAKVTVVVWGENANDEGYSFYKNAEIMATPGEKLTLDSLQGKIICGKEAHTHSASCSYACGKTEHKNHTTACYAGVGNKSSSGAGLNAPSNPAEGFVFRKAWTTNVKVIYINGVWYNYTGTTKSGSIAPTICGKQLHTHSASCGYACGKTEHTHTSACYFNTSFMENPNLWKLVRSDEVTVAADGTTILNVYYDRVEFTLTFKDKNKTVKTITEKWGKNISEYWPIVGNNGKTYNNGERWMPSDSSTYKEVLVYIDIMPAESFTLTVDKANNETYTMHYMKEVLPGESGTVYGGRTFSEKVKVVANYNFVTEKEDFIDFEGFKKFSSNPSFENGRIELENGGDVYFYYTRNSYLLSFYNYNTELTDKQKSVLYEDLISKHTFTPKYPDGLEPNAYSFEGWYTDQFFKNKVLDTTKMPADKVMLYAKWVPKTHTVKTWLTDKKDTPVNVGNTNEQTIAHGMQATEPEKPTNGNYTFVGWFYTENDEEKA
ncbi:MAG: InlB B-repeat-containing protein, partial [Candidatus Faecivicinus sp.]|nr:InlB B-repeat-containing protein [Candidatus Faecivicinus sp.]